MLAPAEKAYQRQTARGSLIWGTPRQMWKPGTCKRWYPLVNEIRQESPAFANCNFSKIFWPYLTIVSALFSPRRKTTHPSAIFAGICVSYSMVP